MFTMSPALGMYLLVCERSCLCLLCVAGFPGQGWQGHGYGLLHLCAALVLTIAILEGGCNGAAVTAVLLKGRWSRYSEGKCPADSDQHSLPSLALFCGSMLLCAL